MAIEEVFIPEVIQSVVSAMKVQKPGAATGTWLHINYEPGRDIQILDSLANKNGTSYDSLKYPLIAVVMPLSEKNGSSFLEVTFPRIVIAHLTKTGTNTETVIEKYNSQGVLKNYLRPCLREFIRRLAWSTYTNLGDPDAYEYETLEQLSQQPIGKGLNDFVDIIEILNLKATIFPYIKTC